MDVLVADVKDDFVVAKNKIDWQVYPTAKSMMSVQDLINLFEARLDKLVKHAQNDFSEKCIDTFGTDHWKLDENEFNAWLETKGFSFKNDKRTIEMIEITSK